VGTVLTVLMMLVLVTRDGTAATALEQQWLDAETQRFVHTEQMRNHQPLLKPFLSHTA
jgi:hypothetical protein